MGKGLPRFLVRVFDPEDVIIRACEAGAIEFSKDVQSTICLFIARLIEKLWNKFGAEDIDIQFLLAKKVEFEVRISESHLDEFYIPEKQILQHFHSFSLQVNDIVSHITLEQASPVKWKLLNYLEKDYTDEEKKMWGRPLKEYHNPALLNPDEWDTLEEYEQTGMPKKVDYIGSYMLDLDITEIFLAKHNELDE